MLGLGVSLPSWPPSIVVTALFLLGAALGIAGGGRYDAETRLAISQEVQEVKRGTIHGGILLGDTVSSADARRVAADVSRQTGHFSPLVHAAPGLWSHCPLFRPSCHVGLSPIRKADKRQMAQAARTRSAPNQPGWAKVAVGVSHCGAGCTLGDIGLFTIRGVVGV